MRKEHDSKNSIYFDYSLLFTVIFLLGFGLLMIYSTTYFDSSINNEGYQYAGLWSQLKATIIGLILMFIAFLVPHRIYSVLAPAVYVVSILSLFLVLTPLGWSYNGARRWFFIGGVSVQPAEIVKVGVIMVTAVIIKYYKDTPDKSRNTLKYVVFVLLPAFVAALFIYGITNNLSSAIIVGGIAYVMLMVSSPRCLWGWGLGAGVAGLSYLLVVLLKYTKLKSYLGFRGMRILAWLNPEAYADGQGYQTLQSLYSIGSGGFFGNGIGNSIQKISFLPEASSDMIFSVVCEELGFFGAVSLMVLFLLLLYRFLDITRHVKNDFFGNLLVTGVFSQIALQVIINICVATNIIPNTGIPLPFISSGGSNVVILLAEIGVVMNVAQKADFRKDVKIDSETNEQNEEVQE